MLEGALEEPGFGTMFSPREKLRGLHRRLHRSPVAVDPASGLSAPVAGPGTGIAPTRTLMAPLFTDDPPKRRISRGLSALDCNRSLSSWCKVDTRYSVNIVLSSTVSQDYPIS